MEKLSLKIKNQKQNRSRTWNICTRLPRITLSAKIIIFNVFSCEILPVDAFWSWWSIEKYIFEENETQLFAVFLNVPPSFSPKFFSFFLRTGYSSTSLRNWICQNWNTLTSVINMIRITFTVLIFRVIVKEVILKGLPQIQKREWWQKLNLFICYGGNFWRQFVCFSFARNPRKKCACVSHEMTQFVLKK